MAPTLHNRAIGAALIFLAMTGGARAELTLCNRTSYLLDAAIGLEQRPTIATRGWFRIEPGQCRRVIEEPLDAALIYVHARTPPLYGTAPLPQSGHANLCVGEKDFSIADARQCRLRQQLARFTAVKPAETEDGPRAVLAEAAEYSNEQARLAGIQRLLVIAGYDANPIDGVQGAKTESALAQFAKDRQMETAAVAAPEFFARLFNAAENPQGHGFSWCNDTEYIVMASLGIVEMGAIVTRGWYRLDPGACVRPDLRGEPRRVYSYAEAVDADGRAILHDKKPMAWGGDVDLCTRDGKFELSDHKDCKARGLATMGFAAVDIADRPAATVRFKDR